MMGTDMKESGKMAKSKVKVRKKVIYSNIVQYFNRQVLPQQWEHI